MKRVTIYTTQYCAFCAAAKELLLRKRVYAEEIDVTGDETMRERLVAITGGLMTVPQIWVDDAHVGGYRDLVQLDERGQLDTLLGLAEEHPMPRDMA